jgi:hypothetical protein
MIDSLSAGPSTPTTPVRRPEATPRCPGYRGKLRSTHMRHPLSLSLSETAAFAVNTLRSWWITTGARTYPTARRLLITADSGGANGNRHRAWKTELAAPAAETGLQISVCYLPPGTSKWNNSNTACSPRSAVTGGVGPGRVWR